jgi:hypothetical protein
MNQNISCRLCEVTVSTALIRVNDTRDERHGNVRDVF